MLQDKDEVRKENRTNTLSARSCFVCGPDNPRGLRLAFQTNESGEMTAEWIPEPEMEGYQGIVHGGIVSTVLDEAMAKAVLTGADGVELAHAWAVFLALKQERSPIVAKEP